MKTIYTALLIASFATMVMVGSASATVLTLSDDELSTEFAKVWGPGTVTAITDISGEGVQFDFTGLNTSSGTGVSDDFPVSQKAGGAWKTYGTTNPFSTWGDFSVDKFIAQNRKSFI